MLNSFPALFLHRKNFRSLVVTITTRRLKTEIPNGCCGVSARATEVTKSSTKNKGKGRQCFQQSLRF